MKKLEDITVIITFLEAREYDAAKEKSAVKRDVKVTDIDKVTINEVEGTWNIMF
ncbi:MAG: hypothetical protein OEW69_00235 [Nitrospirota bacterium]|nr:hypothetical protein [Nitrospirota bacterium]